MPETSRHNRDRTKILHDLKTPITSAKLKLQLVIRFLSPKAFEDSKIKKVAEILSSMDDDFDRYIEVLDKAFNDME